MKKSNERRDAARLAEIMFTVGRLMREGFQKRNRAKPARSLVHLQTLRYVKEKKHPLMRDVAEFLFVTPPAATLLIDGLVKEGFLTRIIDEKDRRAVRVRITAAGIALLARGAKEAMRQVAEVFSVLSGKERSELVVLLEKVVKSR